MPILPLIDLLILGGWSSLAIGAALKAIAETTSYRPLIMSMGPSAVLDTGKVQIAVISRHTEPYDLGVFRSLGIEPTRKRTLVLKSRIHYRAGFRAIARQELPCNGVGVTSSDNALFDFRL